MSLLVIWGGLMLLGVAWQVFDTLREVWLGAVTFKTRSGGIIFEYGRATEPALFWLLTIVKLVLLTFVAIVAMLLVVS